ncbi:hypothetical protein SJI19_06225 [Acerihabitans sp. TG2]|uniref:GNAT family N-acetyltransferase n=1 Tax=Acerihabitans sp. TG2 TaxID=3096008 RepID=UPI002B23D3BB|nr:hypothetical protein [Acerihabitans sp. TG2]MEA9390150.1 hypothetical protein [Acerihabitans sp. TG2]
MKPLTTSRFLLQKQADNDWPFFLRLRQDENVMRYISDILSVEENRVLFDSRQHPWKPGDVHPLNFVIWDRRSITRLGIIGLCLSKDPMSELR